MSRIQFGLNNVHLAKISEGNYEPPVKVPGAVSLKLKPVQNNMAVKDSSMSQLTISETVTNYTGSIEFAMLPHYFLTEILGYFVDENNVKFESAEVSSSPFALLFEINGDTANRRYVLYNCMVTGRHTLETETIGGKGKVMTESFDLEVRPNEDKYLKAYADPSQAEIYNNWFDQVYTN